MDASASWTADLLSGPAMGRQSFYHWCQRVRALLGWSAGTPEAWADLYVADCPPAEAARRTRERA